MIPPRGPVRCLSVEVSVVMIDCRSIARVIGLLAWAATAVAIPLGAGELDKKPAADRSSDAARLLELGDRYSANALAKARARYDELRTKPAYDARIQYALALVLIRQHGHQEAAELLGEMLAREPESLHLWRARIWAEMAMHEDHEALAGVRSMTDVLAKQSPSDLPAADAEDRRATAGFLGRVFCFLEVPREDALSAAELRSAKQYVLARLGDERAEFERNEEAVAEKIAKAYAAFEEQRAKRLAEGKTKQNAIEQQKKAIDETQTNVDYDTEKVKANTKTEVERLSQAIEMINKNVMTSQYRLNAVQQAINENQAKLNIQREANAKFLGGPPPELLIRESEFINLLQRLTAERLMLTKQVGQLTEEVREAIVRRDAMVDLGDKTTVELKTQAVTLKREEKKRERFQQAEAKKIAAQRNKTLLTKQMSFATLEPFPFETEKQRVLGTNDP
jgi:hypothetical protein